MGKQKRADYSDYDHKTRKHRKDKERDFAHVKTGEGGKIEEGRLRWSTGRDRERRLPESNIKLPEVQGRKESHREDLTIKGKQKEAKGNHTTKKGG